MLVLLVEPTLCTAPLKLDMIWAFANNTRVDGSDVLLYLFLVHRFELGWRFITQQGRDSFGVVNVIEKLAAPILRVREVLIITQINPFVFESVNHALDKSVLDGTTSRRHARLDI